MNSDGGLMNTGGEPFSRKYTLPKFRHADKETNGAGEGSRERFSTLREFFIFLERIKINI